MNNELFAQVKNLSLELRELIKQGVKEGVAERIEQRNALLQQWFSGIQELIEMTNEQQLFLENLLVEEQQMLDFLQQEQHDLAEQNRNQRKLTQYFK